MKKLTYSLVLGSLITLFSCGNNAEEETAKADLRSNVEVSKMLIAKIDSLENIVYDESFDIEDLSSSHLMEAYREYTTKFVADKKKTPEYLYKYAAMSRAVNLPVKAIKAYDRILVDYPGYERNPEVAFLLAFTYDEDLSRPEQAKEAYQDVIDKYPGDKWAEQASIRLSNIDKSDEELVKEFMEKNKAEQN